jgi:hypothetical protein
MSKITTFEKFCSRAEEIHGPDRYKYFKEEYTKTHDKTKIECLLCGNIFYMKPNHHIHMKSGCSKCGRKKAGINTRKGFEEFLKRAKKKYGDRFKFNEASFTMMSGIIEVLDSICGKISTPSIGNFLNNKGGCKYCRDEKTRQSKLKPVSHFLNLAKEEHGDLYGYDEIEYKDMLTKIKILCKICNEYFWQTPTDHTHSGAGCPKCGLKRAADKNRKTLEQFKIDANEKHPGNICNYDKVVYINTYTKIKIGCNICGREFTQTPTNHLAGYGCYLCKASSGEKLIMGILEEMNINYKFQFTIDDIENLPFDFGFKKNVENHILEYDGEQHFKTVSLFDQTYKERQEIDILKMKEALKQRFIISRIDYTANSSNIRDIMKEILNIPEGCKFYCNNPELYGWIFEAIPDLKLYKSSEIGRIGNKYYFYKEETLEIKMTSYKIPKTILHDAEILYVYDDPSSWEILKEAGYVKEKHPYYTPIEYFTQNELYNKKNFGFWCHLFLKRTTCLEISLELKNLTLVRYYISRGAPVTSKAFYLAIEGGIEYLEAIFVNLNPKFFLRLTKPTKANKRGELPNNIEFIKRLLVLLENPLTLGELRHILRILPYGIEDKLTIKKIWLKELEKEPDQKIQDIPEPDEVNPPNLLDIRQGKSYDDNATKYLISTGHIELKSILEDLIF